MKKTLVLALLLAAAVAGAQTTATKKELVAKVLLLQQPGIEGIARMMVEQPAAVMMQRAGNVMQTRTPPDKREAIGKEIQSDLKKYVDEAVPLVRERALKLAPATIGALLDERFTEDELKQLVVILESPVNRKFQQLDRELTRSLQERLFADVKGMMEPKLKSLEVAVAGRLGIPVNAPAASGPARAPARAASN